MFDPVDRKALWCSTRQIGSYKIYYKIKSHKMWSR